MVQSQTKISEGLGSSPEETFFQKLEIVEFVNVHFRMGWKSFYAVMDQVKILLHDDLISFFFFLLLLFRKHFD